MGAYRAQQQQQQRMGQCEGREGGRAGGEVNDDDGLAIGVRIWVTRPGLMNSRGDHRSLLLLVLLWPYYDCVRAPTNNTAHTRGDLGAWAKAVVDVTIAPWRVSLAEVNGTQGGNEIGARVSTPALLCSTLFLLVGGWPRRVEMARVGRVHGEFIGLFN